MSLPRLIARLDVKGKNVVKGVQMEGLRVVGDPATLAKKYANAGADELYYLDTVASLYGRNQLYELLEQASTEVFIPITVGGGIRQASDIRRAFLSGADKVAINTAAIERPEFISESVAQYGSQAVVVAIDAKRRPTGDFEVLVEGGRQATGKNAVAWAYEAVERGCGELLITSIDRDGTRRGFDLDLIRAVSDLPVPVVACGGCGKAEHIEAAFKAKADAVAVASALHYGKISLSDRTWLRNFRRGAWASPNRADANGPQPEHLLP